MGSTFARERSFKNQVLTNKLDRMAKVDVVIDELIPFGCLRIKEKIWHTV
jgi:hypothetical protein